MRKASWILLLLVAVLTLLGSLESAWIALSQAPDGLVGNGPVLMGVADTPPEVVLAIRARRVTASAYAAAFTVLFLAVIWFSYRRGEVWSWWGILVAWLVLLVLIILRVPMLGTRSGVSTALVQFGIVGIALLLDVRRLRRKEA
jgi:hypothetical protein